MSTYSGSESSFRSLTRHDEYYHNGGDLHFLVEHITFRVHRYFFDRESPYFRGKLSTPASPGALRQGTEDSNAIVLDDVKSSEFARFLWVFYNPRYSLYDATVEEWCSILRLACRWEFREVKALCVRQLETLTVDDVDRIHIYHTYDIDRNLLIPRYAALCSREEPLTVPEGLKLGMETTLMIARARECARAAPRADSGARSPTRADVEPVVLNDIIMDVFKIEPPAPATNGATGAPVTNGVNGINGHGANGASTSGTNGTQSPTPPNLIDVASDIANSNGTTNGDGTIAGKLADATKTEPNGSTVSSPSTSNEGGSNKPKEKASNRGRK